jgi:hypothetical protein
VSVLKSHNYGLTRRNNLKHQGNDKVEYQRHILSSPSAMPIPPLMHNVARP